MHSTRVLPVSLRGGVGGRILFLFSETAPARPRRLSAGTIQSRLSSLKYRAAVYYCVRDPERPEPKPYTTQQYLRNLLANTLD